MSDVHADSFGMAGPRDSEAGLHFAGIGLADMALAAGRSAITASAALANHVSFLSGQGGAAAVRSAKLEDLLALGRFLAREACPDRPLTNRCRQLRQAAIARAADALGREDRLHLVVERDGAVCAALPLRIAGRRIVAGRALLGQAALAFDPQIGLSLIEHVAQCCRLAGWTDLTYLTRGGDHGVAEALAATLRARGLCAEACRQSVSLLERLRIGGHGHRISIRLAPPQ